MKVGKKTTCCRFVSPFLSLCVRVCARACLRVPGDKMAGGICCFWADCHDVGCMCIYTLRALCECYLRVYFAQKHPILRIAKIPVSRTCRAMASVAA